MTKYSLLGGINAHNFHPRQIITVQDIEMECLLDTYNLPMREGDQLLYSVDMDSSKMDAFLFDQKNGLLDALHNKKSKLDEWTGKEVGV